MIGSSGHGILSRVRSHRKLRASAAAEDMETHQSTHRRQHSDSASMSRSPSTTSPFNGHWPPLEWDPLKLNPPVRQVPAAPARLHERQPLQTLRTKRSFAGHEHRRPARLHHSDSGLTLAGYGDFDFKQERAKALQIISRDHRQGDEVNTKGWPSPASSLDSDKSWFDYDDDDDDDHEDDDGAVTPSNDIWEDAPSPQRRPQVVSPDDPAYFIKRGAWKRKGIFFGGQTEEVHHHNEDDAFEI